jgi:hypothetical protein
LSKAKEVVPEVKLAWLIDENEVKTTETLSETPAAIIQLGEFKGQIVAVKYPKLASDLSETDLKAMQLELSIIR